MEIQHQRDSEQLCGTEGDVGMREWPMCVDDVGPPLATGLDALEEPADDVGDGEQLQPGLVRHLARGAFFVGEHFPGGGRVAETVHLDAVDFVAFQPFVRGGENLDVEARFLEVRKGGTQPGDFGVFVKTRIDGPDDKNFLDHLVYA